MSWIIIAGIFAGILVAASTGAKNKRNQQRVRTISDDKQEIIEQVTIIQPIIQDNQKK